MVNAGLNYIFRPKWPREDFRPFLFVGMQNLAGISFKVNNHNGYFTSAMGITFTDPLEKKGKLTIGLFYDRDDSLLWSLYVNGSEDYRVRLNVYPGLINIFEQVKISCLLGYDGNGDYTVGLSFNTPIGLAYIID